MELPDGRISFKIGLVILINIGCDRHIDTQAASHVAIAKTPLTTSRG